MLRTEGIKNAVDFLCQVDNIIKPNRGSYSTYGLKHIIEKCVGSYISNDECIAACEELNIRLVWSGEGNPSVGLSRKSIFEVAMTYVMASKTPREKWNRLFGYVGNYNTQAMDRIHDKLFLDMIHRITLDKARNDSDPIKQLCLLMLGSFPPMSYTGEDARDGKLNPWVKVRFNKWKRMIKRSMSGTTTDIKALEELMFRSNEMDHGTLSYYWKA